MRESAVRRRGRVGVAALVVLAAGVLALAPAVGASAHDYLVSSTPAADSTQTKALSKVVLTFDDRVLDLSGDGSSNVVEVVGPGGKHFEDGCPVIADTDVTVPVALGASGEYTVTWQIVSADGHTVSDSIAFGYDKPSAATAATGRAARPACGNASSGSGSNASVATPGAAADSSSGSDLVLAFGIGAGVIVLALIAVVVVLMRVRRLPPAAPIRQQPGRSKSSRSKRKPPPAE